MTLIDTHTHLYLPEFDSDRTEVMTRAINAGVAQMILPNVDCTTIAPMRRLHEQYPDITHMAMGLHPTEVGERWRDDIKIIATQLKTDDFVAVGEIGIDLYWDKTYITQQMEAFEMQVEWAAEAGLPVIIHCREGLDQTLEVLDGFRGRVSGVFHSFGGNADDVERIRQRGDFYFGINGIVTFKNSKLRDVLPAIGAERILLETDAPYLAPVPYRGKRNETAYVAETARMIADALSLDLEEIADVTTCNAKKLFSRME